MKSQLDENKIAVFFPSFRGGGAERAMLTFASALTRRGFAVDVIVLDAHGPFEQEVTTGMRIVDLKRPRMLRAIPDLIQYLRVNRPAVLYATIGHTNIGALIANLLARTGSKIVVRESNTPISEQKSRGRWVTFKMIPYFYPLAHRIIAVSELVAEQLRTVSPGLASLITVAPTPVVSPDFYRLSEEPYVLPWNGEPVPLIVSAARLEPHKGFVSLVRAFAAVRKVRPAKLMILGDGSDRTRIVAEIERLGLENDVVLAGFVNNPFPIMKRAHVFVLASEYEGMPNVLIQAMALGAAIVATDSPGGNRELLRDGELGTLVPVGDDHALCDAIIQAIESKPPITTQALIGSRYGVEESTSAYLAAAGLPMKATCGTA